jgi:hypothetical protein
MPRGFPLFGASRANIIAMPFVRRFWPLMVLALAPLLVLWRGVFLGHVIGPFDQIRQMAPWNQPAPGRPWDVLQADGVLQFHQWRGLVFEAWSGFELPFWNHYQLAGTPLLANSQSAALYPPHILVGLLRIPTALGMVLLAWFHLALAGLGAYYLARRLGANAVGGVVAGLSFSLSAFMVSWTGLPSVITTVAWIPWALGLTVAVFQQGRVSAWRTAAMLALTLGMMVLGGHLQFSAYGFLAVGLMGVWMLGTVVRPEASDADIESVPSPTLINHPALRSSLRFGLAVAAGVLLAAPQLLPVLQYSEFSHRRGVATAAGYEAYKAGAIKPFELVGLVHPNLVGTPSEFAPGLDVQLPGYWRAFVKRGGNFAEGALGVGPLVIALLFFSWRRLAWRRVGGILLIGIVAILLATGSPIGQILYFGVPGWSATGSPGRISVLFVLALCVLAGVAASREPSDAHREKWHPYLPIIGMVVAAVVSVYTVMFGLGGLSPWMPTLNQEALAMIIDRSTAGPRAMAMISTLIVASLVGYWIAKDRRPQWALPAAAVLGLLFSVPQVLRFSPSDDLTIRDMPDLERVAFVNQHWDLLTATPALAPPNTGIASRVHEVGGYDSLIHRDTVRMLQVINRGDPAPPANGNMMFVKPDYNLDGLIHAGVSRVYTRSAEGEVAITPVQGRRIEVSRADGSSSPATIVSEGFSFILVEAEGPGRLVLRDRMMPGWSAMVGGRPVEINPHNSEDPLWRTIDLPDGKSVVKFLYVPPGFTTGVAVGLPVWLAVLLVLLFPFRAINQRRSSGFDELE